MNKRIAGTAYCFGANIDTDQIYPGRYLDRTDPAEVGCHAMEGADAHFVERFTPGGIIVASSNFGCGSSREHAAVTLKALGVGAVVARSFGRIFYRNAINLGIVLVVCPQAHETVKEGHSLTLDLERSLLTDETAGLELPCEPISDYALTILEAGGIKPLLRAQYGGQ